MSQLEHLAVALRVVAVRAGVARLRVRVASVRIAVLLALGLLGVRTIPFEETALNRHISHSVRPNTERPLTYPP